MMWLRKLICVGACLLPAVAMAQVEVVPSPSSSSTRPEGASRQVYHSGWGFLTADGTLRGKVVCVGGNGELQPQANATVTLSRDTVPMASGQTQSDGSFAFSGVTEGVYEIAAEAPSCYAINSFQAVRGSSAQSAPAMNVYAANLQRASVDETLQSLWAPQANQAGTRAFEEVLEPYIPATQSPRVAIVNGRVSGQVAFANPYNIAEAHVVKVFRNGSLLTSAPVDNLGTFAFSVPGPGPVDVVLGGSAYASLGVHLVDANQLSDRSQAEVNFVSLNAQTPSASTLLIPAVGGPSQQPGAIPGMGPQGVPMPLVGGFGGGGGFQGGGGSGGGLGGGGFGGIGGALLGAAGLAVGFAALNEDDEDGFVVNQATPLR